MANCAKLIEMARPEEEKNANGLLALYRNEEDAIEDKEMLVKNQQRDSMIGSSGGDHLGTRSSLPRSPPRDIPQRTSRIHPHSHNPSGADSIAERFILPSGSAGASNPTLPSRPPSSGHPILPIAPATATSSTSTQPLVGFPARLRKQSLGRAAASDSYLPATPSPLSIATYNILHDDLFPTPPRIPHLIKTILSADTVHAAAATAMPADIDKLFEDAGGIVPYGPTYGPLRNPLAAATMRESAVPQSGEGWNIKSTVLFGSGDGDDDDGDRDPPSDHYGLKVVLVRRDGDDDVGVAAPEAVEPALSSVPVPAPADDPNTPLDCAAVSPHDQLLLPAPPPLILPETTLRSVFCYPPPPRGGSRDHHLSALSPSTSSSTGNTSDNSNNNAITNTPNITSTNTVQIRIECAGSYALGAHTSGSDADCLAVGNVSAATFWAVARSRIRRNERMRRRKKGGGDAEEAGEGGGAGVGAEEVQMFDCGAQKLVGAEGVLTLRNLLSRPPSLFDAFRTAHLEDYTAHVLTLVGPRPLASASGERSESEVEKVEAHHLARQFFAAYAKWDWERDVVWPIPSREPPTAAAGQVQSGGGSGSGGGYRRSPTKELMVVLSIERPLANLTFHASRNSVEVMRRALKEADGLLDGGESWGRVCGLGEEEEEGIEKPYVVFLKQHKAFIKLDAHFWGGSNLKGRVLIGWLESRIASLLVQLHTAAPSINAQFWTARFVDAGTVDIEDTIRDPNGFYLFGLSPSSSSSPPSASTSRASCLQVVLAVYIWDLKDPSKPYMPTPGGRSTKLDEITSVAWNQYAIAGASSTGYTVVWDLGGKREVVALAYGGGAGTLAGQASHGNGLAVGGRRGMGAIAWHPDNATRLVTASKDDSSPVIMVWDLRNARAPEKILTGHEKGVLSLSWCKQDQDLLLSCGTDNRVLCWNPQSLEIIGGLPSAGNWAFQVKWCPRNPDLLASAFFDGTVGIHSIQSTNESTASTAMTTSASGIFRRRF
ncbi:hypothetical protein D9757_010187 [Collybiopsis confluens]|uniref:Protein transport protein SEC31 n=1 Tax=Collybiopsis confluens TaxID=2823264 RepID=A0A8H5LYT9_9AGAR|nr:hypothetical protein D9757_010187 [Collybiopsis confluens]